MSTEITLPALGESVTEGTVSRWLKQVGDTVAADEPLLEVSTDKVDTEIPSPAAGVLLEIRVAEDDTAQVGAVLGVIGEAGEQGAEAPAAEATAEPAAAPEPDSAAATVEPERAVAEAPPAPVTEPTTPQETPPAPAAEPAAAAPAAAPTGDVTEVLLPALGESVTEGTVSRWFKAVGETVAADEPLLEVSTDKVDTEIPSPAAGVLLEIRVTEDNVAEVGGVLGVIGEPSADGAPETQAAPPSAPEPGSAPADTTAPASPPVAPPPVAPTHAAPPVAEAPAPKAPEPPKAEPVAEKPAAPTEAAKTTDSTQPARRVADESGVYVTPLVRKLAAQHDVDLHSIKGTGVGGRIRKQDVIAAVEAKKQPAPAEPSAKAAAAPATPAAPAADSLRGTTEKMSRLRATIARRMVESLQVSAQLTATVEVDVTSISRLRAKYKEEFKRREGASLSYLPFITKATVEALKEFPVLNASIDTEAGTISYAKAEHIGIAVDTEKGLLVPVIKDAGDLSLAGIAKKIGDLAARTRANKVTPDELSGGTFTITNYGSAGTLFDTPIINQPQVAILGTGALVKRPVVISDPQLGETIGIRDMMYLSLSYDHRLVDGALAARFLSAIKTRLEEGKFAAELG